MDNTLGPTELLQLKFGEDSFTRQATCDQVITLWMPAGILVEVLSYLKTGIPKPFLLLYDITAIDERPRKKEHDYPSQHFTLVYHLLSFGRNCFIRLKIALPENELKIASITKLWPNANWYEREVFDMFGIRFEGHPNLCRLLMPLTWEGHPLRKEHPARATEMGPFRLFDEKEDREQANLQFHPESGEWKCKVRIRILCF
jgi:NADH-quinone oxidoreductase subunit C/D